MNMHNNDIFNVRRCGAVGDGFIDDTHAIQSAVDLAAQVSGQVYFPAGTYACSTIQLKPHITLTGCATWTYWYFKGSVIKLVDDQAPCLMDATGAIGTVINGLALDGLGQKGVQLGKNIHGIMVQDTLPKPESGDPMNPNREDALRIERSLIRNFSGDGLHLNGIWVFTVRHSMVANNLVNGIYVHGYDGFIIDCWLSANHKAGYGAYDRLNASVTMTANRIEWNREGGIIICGGNNYNITGNFFDRSGGPAIWLRPDDNEPCSQFTITGNILRRNGAHWRNLHEYANSHVILDGCRGVVFTGNAMSIGQDDDSQGEFTPDYGIVYRNSQNCLIKDNVLHDGALKELVVDLGKNDMDTVIVKDNPGGIAQGKM